MKYSHREPEFYSQDESEAMRYNAVAVQLCLSEPFSGPSETVAADTPDQNAEEEDDGQLDHEEQGTSNKSSPLRIPKLRNGDLNICFLNANHGTSKSLQLSTRKICHTSVANL